MGRNEPRAVVSRLRRERERRGWTQAYLAERLDVDPAYISRWERGVVSPTGAHRRRLCEVLERDAEELGLVEAGPPAAPAPSEPAVVHLALRRAVIVALLAVVLVAGDTAVTVASPAAARRGWPTARYDLNAQSDRVRAIQLLLIAEGQGVGPTGADGVFGSATQAGVQTFQRSSGLPVSGVVDGPTWERLAAPVRPGRQGPEVEALQRLLRSDGAGKGLSIDGEFGPRTTAAVRRFQQAKHLRASGVVDSDTWCLLVGGRVATRAARE